MMPPNTLVSTPGGIYRAWHPDCRCERCRKIWTIAVFVDGKFMCWECANQEKK